MRTIKFRGLTSKGKTVYGYAFRRLGNKTWEIMDYYLNMWQIKKDTLAQLCGVDKNGREVYEGDSLLDDIGMPHTAQIYDRPAFLATLTLKP